MSASALPCRWHGLHTIVRPGIVAAHNDAAVLRVIEHAQRHSAPGPTSIVGLRNEHGCVYRVVYARGAVHALALAAQLEDLGLVDDPSELDKAVERCDAVYGPPGAHPSQRRVRGARLRCASARIGEPTSLPFDAAPASA